MPNVLKHIGKAVVLASLLIAGCSTTTTHKEPGMQGYVVDKDHERILVVDPVSKDFSETGGVDEFHEAILFSDVPSTIKIGQKVNVWFDIVAESYPGQSSAEKVEVLKSVFQDTVITEDEAIRRAITLDKRKHEWFPIVKSVVYNKREKQWEIVINKGEDKTIIVSDEKGT